LARRSLYLYSPPLFFTEFLSKKRNKFRKRLDEQIFACYNHSIIYRKCVDRKKVGLPTFLTESRRVVRDGGCGQSEYISRAAHRKPRRVGCDGSRPLKRRSVYCTCQGSFCEKWANQRWYRGISVLRAIGGLIFLL
jgi:hypothetical protein